MKVHENDIANPDLASNGELVVSWSRRNMPVLEQIRERFSAERPFTGIRIGACLHITSETANLIVTLKEGGADVFLCASNPLSTQDETTAYLVSQGIHVYAVYGEDIDRYFAHCNHVLDGSPHIVIDDGGDLTRLLHSERRSDSPAVIGGLEETTTGVIRIRNLMKSGNLIYPIIAINDAKTKHLFDNRYGTGQSTIDSILRSTNVLIAGSLFVVAGYGMVGKGITLRAKGFGANVIVTEVDPVRALEAAMDGYRVMPMDEAAKIGDIFVTATGNKGIIREEHFRVMKDNAMVANAGHFNVEVDLIALKELSQGYSRQRRSIEEYTLKNGNRIIVLGEGRLVNLCAAEGHPANVMDMSFANQALGCEYLLKNRGNLPAKVLDIPEEIDLTVASMKLQAMGIRMDKLTDKQVKYLNAWEEGTE